MSALRCGGCAYGGLRVAIVEARMIGGGATAAGMGHLVVMDDSEAQFALTRYSQLLWEEIGRLPREVEHDACGTIWVAADDEEMLEVERKQKFYSERGVKLRFGCASRFVKRSRTCALVGGLRAWRQRDLSAVCREYFVDSAAAKGGRVSSMQ